MQDKNQFAWDLSVNQDERMRDGLLAVRVLEPALASVAAMVGAGLTNMLFMKRGGSVLELRHASDHINNCYFTLSSALNLNYFYQTCEPSPVDSNPHTADLIVDPRTLESNLRIFTNLNRL